jgi:3-phenylpropionate/trans-cinnamate dioxygenase ferredoxin subunit
MAEFIEVARTDELQEGIMKAVQVAGGEVLLAKIGDQYYATDNRCPHLGGKLSQGKLAGAVVTCPRHGSQFDLSDGRVVRWLTESGVASKIGKFLKPPRQLTTYDVRVQDDRIMIAHSPRPGKDES